MPRKPVPLPTPAGALAGLAAATANALQHLAAAETLAAANQYGPACSHLASIAAAEALGMVRTGRLREWFARPGRRVDCLVYQALNARWEVRDA